MIAREGDMLVGITVAEITTAQVEPELDRARIDEIVTTIAEQPP